MLSETARDGLPVCLVLIVQCGGQGPGIPPACHLWLVVTQGC